MSVVQQIRNALRRRPLTPEELATREEGKHIVDEMRDNRASQSSVSFGNVRSPADTREPGRD